MVFSDSICHDFPDTSRIKAFYIVFYQGGPIDHCTHVPVPVAQFSAESEYSSECTLVMALAHFRMLNKTLMNKDTDVVL